MGSDLLSLVKGIDPRLIPKIIALIGGIGFSVDYGNMKIAYYLEHGSIFQADIAFLITITIILIIGIGGFYLCLFLYKKYLVNSPK